MPPRFHASKPFHPSLRLQEGIVRVVLVDKVRYTCCNNLKPSNSILTLDMCSLHSGTSGELVAVTEVMRFDRIDWNWAFFKTHHEKRSFVHLLVNFNHI